MSEILGINGLPISPKSADVSETGWQVSSHYSQKTEIAGVTLRIGDQRLHLTSQEARILGAALMTEAEACVHLATALYMLTRMGGNAIEEAIPLYGQLLMIHRDTHQKDHQAKMAASQVSSETHS